VAITREATKEKAIRRQNFVSTSSETGEGDDGSQEFRAVQLIRQGVWKRIGITGYALRGAAWVSRVSGTPIGLSLTSTKGRRERERGEARVEGSALQLRKERNSG